MSARCRSSSASPSGSVVTTGGYSAAAAWMAYRFGTADGSVGFSADTTVNDGLAGLAEGADILVHQVADLGYLERHGLAGAALERMAALHTDVFEAGSVAERAGVRELILSHYLPAAVTEAEWAGRAAQGLQRDDNRRPRRPGRQRGHDHLVRAAPGDRARLITGASMGSGWAVTWWM